VGGELRPFAIRLRTRFRGLDVRRGLLLRGAGGWGEFSPFADYNHTLRGRWLASAREAAAGAWPRPLRTSIPVNATVPAVSPEDAHAIAARAGCSSVKVKVAEGDDDARVAAVREAVGPDGRIRLDANGAWTVDEAVRNIRALARHGLEYVEQPVATLSDMARVRARVDVPLALDESVRTAADPLRIDAAASADIVVLKTQPLGGVAASLRVAEACGLPCVVSSALETSVGIAAGVALAAALPELPHACGLATVTLLEGDVVRDPLVPARGALEVRRPRVDEEALRACAPVEGDAEIARLMSYASSRM
jgi:O-succinylbenzoate synthase